MGVSSSDLGFDDMEPNELDDLITSRGVDKELDTITKVSEEEEEEKVSTSNLMVKIPGEMLQLQDMRSMTERLQDERLRIWS